MTSMLEDRRKNLGMSRADVANLSGLPNSSVWALEMGKQVKNSTTATNAALKSLEAFLEQEEHKRDSGWTAPAYKAPPGGTVSPEYRGLKLGDRFTLRTEPGLFTFLGLVRERLGTEYIACYGGPPGYGMQRPIPIWKVKFPADPLAHDLEDDEIDDNDTDLQDESESENESDKLAHATS